MLDIHRDDGPATKVYFSHSSLPSYIDPQNVSTKKKPFSTFNAQPFSHTLDLILPEEIYALVRAKLEQDGHGVYAKVYMSLGDILSREFFDSYIKKGNITMLSSGRPLLDNHMTLHAGLLTLHLDRPTYERTGLQGTPIEDGGKKHQKNRFEVTYDLRLPSMVHGKKGFGRLEWAAKNVLNHTVTWLFYNHHPLAGETLREGSEAVSKHHPKVCEMRGEVERLGPTRVPGVRAGDVSGLYAGEDALALYEWLGMVALGSPRVRAEDRIDALLSRYEVPDFGGLVAVQRREMVRVRWRGLVTAEFARGLFLLVRRDGLRVKREGASQSSSSTTVVEGEADEERWVAWSAVAFGGRKAWSVMQWAGRETLCWECEE